MNEQALARWDLPYRYGSRLFVPTASLHVVAPAVLFLALGLVDAFILVPHAGSEITSSNAVGLPWSLLVRPAFVALYFWMPHAIAELMQRLPGNGVVRGSRVERELELLRRLLAHPALPAVALLAAAAGGIISWRLLAGGIPQFSLSETGGRAIFSYVLSGAVYYAVTMSVFRGFAVTRLLFRLSSATDGVELSVDPHHPDGAGGWAELGEYLAGVLIAVAAGIVAVSIVFYSNTLHEAWQQLALASGLVMVFILTIALPAWLAYVMMRPSRQAALREIQARRRNDHEALQRAVAGGEDIAPWLSSLRSLDEAAKSVRNGYPVLPFRRPALLTFNTVTSLSIILGTTSTAVALFRTLTGS